MLCRSDIGLPQSWCVWLSLVWGIVGLASVSVVANEVRIVRGGGRTKANAVQPLATDGATMAEVAESEYRRPTADDQQATAVIPAEAWGKPVNGLRAALVLRSTAIDAKERLRYDIVVENVSEREIRFGASIHHDYGFYKLHMTDADGKIVIREPGTMTRYYDPPKLIRFRLKPKERTVIASCYTQLVRRDKVGGPDALRRSLSSHYFNVTPGRYSISASVELGPSTYRLEPASGSKVVLSPAKGEWSGKLQTGTPRLAFFADENSKPPTTPASR